MGNLSTNTICRKDLPPLIIYCVPLCSKYGTYFIRTISASFIVTYGDFSIPITCESFTNTYGDCFIRIIYVFIRITSESFTDTYGVFFIRITYECFTRTYGDYFIIAGKYGTYFKRTICESFIITYGDFFTRINGKSCTDTFFSRVVLFLFFLALLQTLTTERPYGGPDRGGRTKNSGLSEYSRFWVDNGTYSYERKYMFIIFIFFRQYHNPLEIIPPYMRLKKNCISAPGFNSTCF